MINRELLDAQKELLASTYSQAQSYTNLVIAAGYAGFFAIWSFVKEDLSKVTVFWSALLICISLASFVGWEIYSMFHRSRSLLDIARAVGEPERFKELILRCQESERERVIAFGRAWLVVFPITVITGFSALFIHLYAFIIGIWRTYYGS